MRPEQSPLYNTARWRKMSKAQLMKEPLCCDCLEIGVITPANQCDHVIPHHGDPVKFWSSPLASRCRECHGKKTAREQGKNPKPAIGVDGSPAGW